MLHELIDLGADLARTLQRAAKAQAESQPEPGAPDLVLAFDRVARTVRRTVLLARSLAEPPRPIPPAKQPAQPAPPDPVAARRTIIRRIEDSFNARIEPEHADALHAEMLERLERPEFATDLATRPLDDIILELRRDLGLANPPGVPPWRRRTPADIEALCTRAAGHPSTRKPPPPPPDPEPEDMDDLIALAHSLLKT